MAESFIASPAQEQATLPRAHGQLPVRSTSRAARPSALRPNARLFVFALALAAFLLAPQIVLFASTPLLPLQARIGLGTVRHGERIRREFVLTNLSLRPVRILSVTGGCGCVAHVAGSPRLSPFATRTIVASFVASGHAGSLQREIVIETDDPHRPYMMLRLEGQATADGAAPGDTHGTSS